MQDELSPAAVGHGVTAHPERADLTAIIPAAGRVPEGLLALSNIASPAMIPVAERPVIYWTMHYLRSLGVRRFVIAVARRGMFVEDFVDCTFGGDCEVRYVVPARDTGVGRTMLDLLEVVETRSALAVLGDTHFQLADASVLDREEPFVLVHPVEESYRWCVAEIDPGGGIRALHDKQPEVPAGSEALIGVYGFPDARLARDAAREAVTAAEAAGRSTQIAPILERIHAVTPIRAVRAGDWLDVGNPDRQASSHRTLLQKREFNELTIDPTFGTITKRSRHVEKFVDEINYLRLLPPELSVLFPRVLSFSTQWNDPWVSMEYYGYPSLSGVFVFENVEPAIWEQIFHHLHEVITRGFMSHQRPLPPGSVHEMYVAKTRERLARLAGPPELLALLRHEGDVILDGRPFANLPILWPRIEAEVAKLAQNARGTIIHGDLCLSNILYDLRSRICKLIDPRGCFGAPGVFGDPRYDVAKLHHSIHGLYDFIVHDLFRIEVQGTRIDLEIAARPQHREIQERFDKVFGASFDAREVLLITALLFASMPALHYDAPRRQMAMYARALALFDEFFRPRPS